MQTSTPITSSILPIKNALVNFEKKIDLFLEGATTAPARDANKYIVSNIYLLTEQFNSLEYILIKEYVSTPHAEYDILYYLDKDFFQRITCRHLKLYDALYITRALMNTQELILIELQRIHAKYNI